MPRLNDKKKVYPRATKIIFMKKLLFLSFIAILALSNCKKWQHKYPEDTERTKLTPEERLTGKTWTLNKSTLNGIDYTDTVLNKIGKLEVYLSTNEETGNLKQGAAEDNVWGGFGILWIFRNNENDLEIFRTAASAPFYDIPSVFYINYLDNSGFGKYTHQILKLTTSDFKIQCTTIAQDSTYINYFQVK